MKITKRQLRKIIQEMARPKLKYNVKVDRLVDALVKLRVDYRNDEMAGDTGALKGFERFDDPVFSSFLEAEIAVEKLAKMLQEEDK